MRRGVVNWRQFAVMLEVALTVHKAQGLTCELVGVDWVARRARIAVVCRTRR
jgi:hypothetical protein